MPSRSCEGQASLDKEIDNVDDILKVLDHEGIPYRFCGTLVHARCPFHEDNDPSLRIYADGHFHCFSCNLHGTAVELVRLMKFGGEVNMHNAYKEAFNYLRGIGVEYQDKPCELYLPERPATTERQKEIMTKAAAHFHRQLSHRQWAYLNERGVSDKVVDHYLIGCCINHPDHRKLGTQEELRELGLENHFGKQTMDNRITIPVWENGQVVFMQGRSLNHRNKIRYMSLKVRARPYFLEEAQRSPNGIAWLVEGPFDALALKSIDQTAVALGGTRLRNGSVKAFNGLTVLLAPDNDSAGHAAREELRQVLTGVARTVIDVELPEWAKDIGDIARLDKLKPWVEYQLSELTRVSA